MLNDFDVLINYEELQKIVSSLFVNVGLSKQQAHYITDCLITAEMSGIKTHGLTLVPILYRKFAEGKYNIKENVTVLREGHSFSVVDAENQCGIISATMSVNYAIEKAKTEGIYTIFVRNSNTYGPAFYYPLIAAREGLIGITLCNTPAAMPVWEGIEKMLGTNPFSIAVPVEGSHPFVFDMATSKVAKSKINEARMKSEKIPLDWAVDSDGTPTDDPIKAINGLLLPIGDHKGYGLAMSFDIIAGLLAGASYLNNVGKFYSDDKQSMNVGQFFLIIDPVKIYGDTFYLESKKYFEKVRSSKSKSGQPIRIPGDKMFSTQVKSKEFGVTVNRLLIEEVKKLYIGS